MITRQNATDLRALATRIEQRGAGSFQMLSAQMDAAELRSIADAMDEHLRPRSRRELDGARSPSLWGRIRRLWTRAA